MSSFLVLKEGKIGETRENYPPKQPLFESARNIPLLQTAAHILNQKNHSWDWLKPERNAAFVGRSVVMTQITAAWETK